MLNPAQDETEHGLRPVVRTGVPVVLACVAFGLLLALLYNHLAERRYRVTLTLVPTEENAAAAQGLGGGLGSLASLAGVELPGGTQALGFELLPDAMISKEIATELARDPALMRRAFPRFWDEASGQWREPDSWTWRATRALRRAAGFDVPPFAAPGPEELHLFLARHLIVQRDRKRPIITVTMTHRDSAFAAEMITRSWQSSDRRIKANALERSTQNIYYIAERLQETRFLEYRDYLLTVLTQEEKRRMSTSSSLPYVAEPFGAAVATRDPVVPNIPVSLALGLIGGLASGLLLVLFWHWKRLAPLLLSLFRDG